jgi:ribokinase
MLGRVGNDAFAEPLKAFLRDMNVRVDGVLQADISTGTALIVVDDQGENTIVVVPGANGTVSRKDVTRVPFTGGDMLISQFEIPLDVVEAFFLNGRQAGAVTVLNPAPSMACPPSLWEAANIVILNETELGFFAGEALAPNIDNAVIINKAKGLRSHPDQVVVVTLGARGAISVVGERVTSVIGRQVKAVDTTGAGDCFVGYFTARLANGETVDAALNYANAASSLCVQKVSAGPSMPTLTEVESLLSSTEGFARP